MDRDLRSLFQRMASAPTRRVDVGSLIAEGRRRRRTRRFQYTTIGVALVVSGVVAVPRLLERETARLPPTPAEPSPHLSPRFVDSPFADFQNGWTELPLPPEVRSGNAATGWTGEQVIVWGGYVYTGFSDEVPQRDGFIFDARSKTWRMMSPSPLQPRIVPASAWTGTEFLIWGGSDQDLTAFFDDGAAYDPAADAWRPLPPAPLTPRAPLSVWTGREFIVWGSATRDERRVDGAAYDPKRDSWRVIADAPIELTDATAVWTGQEMIVFGAALHGGNKAETDTAVGAAFDPATNTWRRIADSSLSPQASTAAWNGRELIAWDYRNNSAAYDPGTDTWRALPDVPLDSPECVPQSVALRGYVFGNYCGFMVVHDRGDDAWHDVTRRDVAGWGFTPVAADPAVLLLGRDVDTGKEVFLAFRYRAWSDEQDPTGDRADVRTTVERFMEHRMRGRGAERFVEPSALGRFTDGGALAPMYFQPELEDFELVFIDGPLDGPTYEVGVRLEFAGGGYGHTYFVTKKSGRYLISGGRHGLEEP